MKNFLRWAGDLTAYVTLPIIYYTLRIARAPFWWIPIESHTEWSMTANLLANDIMMFIFIVVLVVLYAIQGLWWLLYGAIGLLTLLFMAALFFNVRKWYRNKPSYWSWSKKTKN